MSIVKEDHVLAPGVPHKELATGAARPLVAGDDTQARGLRRLLGSALVPALSRQVQRIGGTGVVGIALLVSTVAFFVGAYLPLQGELTDLQASIGQAQQAHGASSASAVPSARAEVQSFMSKLPLRSELPALTGQIVQQAAIAGIALESGTYDFTVTKSAHLVRARMAFPVHGRYPDIRRFIDGTLAAIPGAAVDGLRFERKDIGVAEVDADIRFALYLRSDP